MRWGRKTTADPPPDRKGIDITRIDVNVWSWIREPGTDVARVTITLDRPLTLQLGDKVTGTITSIERKVTES